MKAREAKPAAARPKAKATAKKKAVPVKPAKMKPVAKAKKAASSKSSKTGGAKSPAAKSAKDTVERWNLRLYVAGQTPRSVTAFANLKRLCEERLPGRYKIEVIDLASQPHLAQSDQIIAIPTLVRKLPEPIKRVVGDLSNIERVLVGMDLAALES